MQRSLCTSKQVGGTYRAPSARRGLLPCTYRLPSARSGLLSFKRGLGQCRHRPKPFCGFKHAEPDVGGLSKWDDYQNLPFGAPGNHGPNICKEIGARKKRRRAKGCLYVWETAITMQRALCTFRGNGHPCRSPPRSLRDGQPLEPIRLNFKGVQSEPN